MNSSMYFSFPANWDASDLAHAVPLRLSEMLDFDIARDGLVAASANAVPTARALRHGYVRAALLPAAFRIR